MMVHAFDLSSRPAWCTQQVPSQWGSQSKNLSKINNNNYKDMGKQDGSIRLKRKKYWTWGQWIQSPERTQWKDSTNSYSCALPSTCGPCTHMHTSTRTHVRTHTHTYTLKMYQKQVTKTFAYSPYVHSLAEHSSCHLTRQWLNISEIRNRARASTAHSLKPLQIKKVCSSRRD